MKSSSAVVVLGLFLSASAHAATLSLQWKDQPGVDKISMAPSDTAEIEVVLEFSPFGNDRIVGAFFPLEAGPFTHLENFTSISGWSAGNLSSAVNQPFGQSQFAVAATITPFNVVSGPDPLVVGSFRFRFEDVGLAAGAEVPIAFGDSAISQIIRDDGQFYTLTADASLAVYSGYWIYGKGSPGFTQMNNTIPRDPLIVTVAGRIPEPASMVLLCMAGVSLLLRRN